MLIGLAWQLLLTVSPLHKPITIAILKPFKFDHCVGTIADNGRASAFQLCRFSAPTPWPRFVKRTHDAAIDEFDRRDREFKFQTVI